MKEESAFYDRILRQELIPILKEYADKRQLADLAHKLNIKHKSRLTELKNRKRKLTFFWLNLFFEGGIMGINNITKGRKLSELSEIERKTVLRLAPDDETLTLIHEIEERGLDVKTILKTILKK